MLEEINETKAYFDGFAAYKKGFAFYQSPYSLNTYDRIDWKRGWEDAQRVSVPSKPKRWIDQTRLHDEEAGINGDCTRAAIASFLCLPIDKVPDFNTVDSIEYWKQIDLFFYNQGYVLRRFDKGTAFANPIYTLAVGISPRGYYHMVVQYDGKTIHDPHPSRADIINISYVLIAIPLDPSEFNYKGNYVVQSI